MALINAMVLFKIGWTFVFAEAEGALLHLLPAMLGLVVCNLVLFIVLHWVQRRASLGAARVGG